MCLDVFGLGVRARPHQSFYPKVFHAPDNALQLHALIHLLQSNAEDTSLAGSVPPLSAPAPLACFQCAAHSSGSCPRDARTCNGTTCKREQLWSRRRDVRMAKSKQSAGDEREEHDDATFFFLIPYL